MRTIKCPITNIEHQIISGNNDNDLMLLRIWFKDLQKKSIFKKIYLSLDCEGWRLGLMHKSLKMIQICEILNNFDENLSYKIDQEISIDLQSGFLIESEFNENFKNFFNSLISFPNIFFICYDISSDFCALSDIGINIKDFKFYDCQINSKNIKGDIISTKGESILKSTEKTINLVKESQKCYDFMKDKKGNFFNFHYYFKNKLINPYESLLNLSFYEYAASDLVLTGISFLNCYLNNIYEYTYLESKKKLDLFLNYQKKYFNKLLPSALKQKEFFLKYNLVELNFYFNNFPNISIEEILKFYDLLDKIHLLRNILPLNLIEGFPNLNYEEKYIEVFNFLENTSFQIENQIIKPNSTSLFVNFLENTSFQIENQNIKPNSTSLFVNYLHKYKIYILIFLILIFLIFIFYIY